MIEKEINDTLRLEWLVAQGEKEIGDESLLVEHTKETNTEYGNDYEPGWYWITAGRTAHQVGPFLTFRGAIDDAIKKEK